MQPALCSEPDGELVIVKQFVKNTAREQEQVPASRFRVQFINRQAANKTLKKIIFRKWKTEENTLLSQPSHPQTTADCTGSQPPVSRMVGCFSRGKSIEGKKMGLHEESSCPVQLKIQSKNNVHLCLLLILIERLRFSLKVSKVLFASALFNLTNSFL